jgi:hypothetical protein
VGVAIAGLTLIALAIWALLQHRKSRGKKPEPYRDPKAELPGEAAEDKPRLPTELPENDIAEMAGVEKPIELNPDVRHELEGEWHGHEAREISSPAMTSAERSTL